MDQGWSFTSAKTRIPGFQVVDLSFANKTVAGDFGIGHFFR